VEHKAELQLPRHCSVIATYLSAVELAQGNQQSCEPKPNSRYVLVTRTLAELYRPGTNFYYDKTQRPEPSHEITVRPRANRWQRYVTRSYTRSLNTS